MSQKDQFGPKPQDEGDGEQRRPRILWPKLNTPEWISALAAVAAALVAIASVVVAVQTRKVLDSQLGEMHSSGVDTHNLAVATGNLARAAKSQAADTTGLKQATEDFAVAMKAEAQNSAKLASAATGQLREMEIEQRPLLSIDPTTPINGEPFFEVVNPPPGHGQLAWNVSYTNIGKTPAILDRNPIYMRIGNAPFRCVRNCAAHGQTVRINPNQREFTTGWLPMEKADFDKIMQTGEGVTILVFFDYRDEAGHIYKSDACFSHNPNGSLQDCSGQYRERDMK